MVSSKFAFIMSLTAIIVCSAVVASAEQAPRITNLTESGQMVFRVRDNLSGVDASSIRVIVDGQEARPALTKIPLGYRVSYTPSGSLSGEYSVVLFARDMAKNAMRKTYRFGGACRVVAEDEPKPLREIALAERPLLHRVTDAGMNAMPFLGASQARMRLSPECSGTGGLRSVSAPQRVSAAFRPAPLFGVEISRELRAAEAGQICDVIFTVSGTGAATAGYELFVALIDPSGEVVFYEPTPGCRGTPLEQLERTGESGLRMRLSFVRDEFSGSGYTWCAAVAKAQTPEQLASNVAASAFDAIPDGCDVRASGGLASFP
ncbi:MAG TPA: hypothetical protein VM163_13035 [bacterium]|nr:hypothetical protein [bacterium]